MVIITRWLYLAVGWFAISLLTVLLGGARLRHSNAVISIGWLIGVLLVGDAWALLTFGVPYEIALLTAITFLFGLICIWWMRDWNAFGQVAWTTSITSVVLFIIYAFQVTAFTPLNVFSFILALNFFFIEAIALFIALFHTQESLDATCRIHWRRKVNRLEPRRDYLPMVSLHVPVYNEPPEIVKNTLLSLDDLDYPNYEVLVVDNNTPDRENWQAVESICRQLGPKFRFMHLDKWPGYKSGALNFALTQTHPQAEIIAPIDADYLLDPAYLKELVPAFADPKIAFVQTPQDYRDYEGNTFLESSYHAYRFFFEVSMSVRNEFNAIIFAGTMGLIRKSAIQDIGGWDEWCITEDAEASLRILKRGYSSLYVKRSFGQGLIPFTFEGLKRQRFRWCFGGIQILKKHWSALMPWAHWVDPDNHLTIAQRYFYLAGGVQWFTHPLNLIFAAFLVLGGIFSLFGGQYMVRPLTITLVILPVIFLVLGLWRFAWVLRYALKLSWKNALNSMYNFFSLGWVVALACIQGVIQKEGVFLRTPKSKSASKMLRALSVTRWETLTGLICLGVGLLVFTEQPSIQSLSLGVLLTWQSSLYLSASYFSLMSVYEKPDRARDEQGKRIRENRATWYAFGIIFLLILAVIMVQFFPQPEGVPVYLRFLPVEIPLRLLFGLN